MIIDAGTTQDLTDVIAVAAAAAPCTLFLRSGVEYSWPAGVEWPLGVNLLGDGYDEISAFNPAIGSVINSTGRIVQALGASKQTIAQGVHFTGGLHVRKQRTILIGCRTSGAGLLVGGTNTAPYYSRFIGHRFHADTGGTAVTLSTNCNAVTFDGALFVPFEGRGIDFTGAATGNKFSLSLDYPGSPSAQKVGAVVHFSAAAVSNDFEFHYWEPVAIGTYQDGAHIVFGNGASANRVCIQSNTNGNIRVYHKQTDRVNYVDIQDQYGATYIGGNFYWHLGRPNDVLANTATTIYMPPLTYRRGKLSLLCNTSPASVKAAFVLSAVTVNAAGSGGTDGTYYQTVSDASTVTGQHAVVQVTVSGGAMTACSIKYPGWNTATFPVTFAITAVPGLTGAVINCTTERHEPANVAADSYTIKDKTLTTFLSMNDYSRWIASP